MTSENNKKPVSIVVSDVHLGALWSKPKLFKYFLHYLLKLNESEPIKHLFIIGDFFDLCTVKPEFLKDYYCNVIHTLKKIKDEGIKIHFTLGNHEIPLIQEISDDKILPKYEKTVFSKEKGKFKAKFNPESILGGIIHRSDIFEYYCLKINNGTFESKGCDDKSEINSLFTEGNIVCLTHGHQFVDGIPKAAIIWLFQLNADYVSKAILNFLWNSFLRKLAGFGFLFLGFIAWIQDKLNPNRGYSLYSELKDLHKHIKEIKKFRNKEKNKDHNEYIDQQFLPAHPGITDVIYGHTHRYQIKKIRKNTNNPVNIINSGGWQHIRKPNFVKIHSNGNIEVYKCKKHRNELKIKLKRQTR